jgi:hypothetical protein
MYNNVKSGGMTEQLNLYGSAGEKVLSKYPDKNAMTDKITELGASTVSNHCGDPAIKNVVDISATRSQNPRALASALDIDPRVKRVLSPYNSTDKAIHIEVPQP